MGHKKNKKKEIYYSVIDSSSLNVSEIMTRKDGD